MKRVEFTPDVAYDPAQHMTLAEVGQRLGWPHAMVSARWSRGDLGWLPTPVYVIRAQVRTEIAFDRDAAETALTTGAPQVHNGWRDVPGYVGAQLLWTGVGTGQLRVSTLLPDVIPFRSAYLDGLERQLRRMTGRWVAVEVMPTTRPGDVVKVVRVPPFIWA